MIDLEPMWLALAEYQPFADANGHGETWKRMLENRTPSESESAKTACVSFAARVAAEEAAWAAGYAVARPEFAAECAANSIKYIESAIKGYENVPS